MKKCFLYTLILCISQICLAQNDGSISGQINCLNGAGQTNVLVTLSSDLLSNPLTTMTDANGQYSFSNLPTGGDYRIVPKKQVANILNGLTTYDMVLVARIILGLGPLDPFLWLAADVNGTGTVTTFDMVVMRKIILSIEDDLELFWRYATPDFMLPSADFPQGRGTVGFLDVENLAGDVVGANFIGVRPGDLNQTNCD